MTSDAELSQLAATLARDLRARGLQLVTAESCTGGWVGKVLTEIPGSSLWYLGGVVSYSNKLKTSVLGVDQEILLLHGAVSAATAEAMARGALAAFGGDCSVAVTGVAGPDGGTQEKPVGTVWFCWAAKSEAGIQVETARAQFDGDRDSIRRQAVARALQGLMAFAYG